ncbi:MAG: hypothetical protein HY040_24335 [Planctomycetes bacterium]|nr:hypothetical protein [Planctomycetota bacterium]
MPLKLYEWLERIKSVERENAATRFAMDLLRAHATRDPTVLEGEVTLRAIRHASERLDGTYLIRLFAEFKAGLRAYWQASKSGDPPSRTRDLLDGVAASRRIPCDLLMRAHDVREFRNSLVHERDERVSPISIPIARGHLCRYFSFLPPNW